MIAIITQQIVIKVDDEEEAASFAIRLDKGVKLGIAHELEQHPDISNDQIAEYIAHLGASVSIVPDEVFA